MLEGHEPDGDTQYRIGSLTKTFVAVMLMRLRDEGRLDPADPLRRLARRLRHRMFDQQGRKGRTTS